MRSFALFVVFVAGLSNAQSGPLDAQSYQPAPKEIQSFLDAPRHLNTLMTNQSPNDRYFLLSESAGMPRLADLAKPNYNLGGVQVDFTADRERADTLRGAVALTIVDSSDWTRKRIEAPRGGRIGDADWSSDSTRIAYSIHFVDSTQVFVYDLDSGKSRRLVDRPVLGTFARYAWSGDGQSIFLVAIPEKRGKAPARPEVASQPRVHVSDAAKNRLRTYRNLMSTKEDEGILEYYALGQLVKVDVSTGKTKSIGAPAMIRSFDPSPKGDFVRVTMIQKPFSYLVPVSGFGSKEEIWDMDGKMLVELSNRRLTFADTDTPTPAADPRRGLAWRPDGNGLGYIAADGPAAAPVPTPRSEDDDEQGGRGRGGQAATAPRKEKLVQWVAPFGKDDIKTIYQSDTGIGSVQYSADGKTLYISETVSGTETLNQIFGISKKPVYSYRTSETGKNPGSLVLRDGPLGRPVVREANGMVFLRGSVTPADPMKDAPRPFLDRVDVANAKTTRIFESPADAYETASSFLSEDGAMLIVDRQSPTEISNSYLFENNAKARKLTDNKDYAPDITAAKRYRIQVTRPDGFKFWVKVTAPKWGFEGMKLPAMFWFYPGEFTDQAAYDRGQRTYNKNLFPNVSPNSMSLLTRYGYAFVEPDCPIVGPAGRMNDFYVNDLRNNLSATIDELERRGLIDRSKLAIGGHSYGGFSTGNALVHTPFFKAGIAGAGNYNRSLTPMSFQSETRTLFEARETYMNMSAMLYAENITGALLMYCGMEDQNVGTNPINSERMFHVLESIGKPAALYMYPYEDHGQIAKETLQDMWSRWVPWLMKYVTPSGK